MSTSRAPSESVVCQAVRGSTSRFNATATPAGGVVERSKQQRDRDVVANPHTPAVDGDDHHILPRRLGLDRRTREYRSRQLLQLVNDAAAALHRVSPRPAPDHDVCYDNVATTPVSRRTARSRWWRPL